MQHFYRLDIIWVCGDVCEVAMVVDNPLPAEIKVNKMVKIMIAFLL